MIPLHDNIRARRLPLMNYTIILVNVLIFIYQRGLEPTALHAAIARYGAVPTRLLADPSLAEFGALFTSMFLHGSWFHLISNMWALFIFGDNVQDRMGAWRYLFFYLSAGLAAGALHIVLQASSSLPVIGASGAISGVMGAYQILYPRARVNTLVFIGFAWFVQIPAVVYLGVWFITQLFQGLIALGIGGPEVGGVAWWAHVGGFVWGAALVKFLRVRMGQAYGYADEYSPW